MIQKIHNGIHTIHASLPSELAQTIAREDLPLMGPRPFRYYVTAHGIEDFSKVNETQHWLRNQGRKHVVNNLGENLTSIHDFFDMFYNSRPIFSPIGFQLQSGTSFNTLVYIQKPVERNDRLLQVKLGRLTETINKLGGNVICGLLGSNYR